MLTVPASSSRICIRIRQSTAMGSGVARQRSSSEARSEPGRCACAPKLSPRETSVGFPVPSGMSLLIHQTWENLQAPSSQNSPNSQTLGNPEPQNSKPRTPRSLENWFDDPHSPTLLDLPDLGKTSLARSRALRIRSRPCPAEHPERHCAQAGHAGRRRRSKERRGRADPGRPAPGPYESGGGAPRTAGRGSPGAR